MLQKAAEGELQPDRPFLSNAVFTTNVQFLSGALITCELWLIMVQTKLMLWWWHNFFFSFLIFWEALKGNVIEKLLMLSQNQVDRNFLWSILLWSIEMVSKCSKRYSETTRLQLEVPLEFLHFDVINLWSARVCTSWKTVADLLTFPDLYLAHQTTSLTGPDIFMWHTFNRNDLLISTRIKINSLTWLVASFHFITHLRVTSKLIWCWRMLANGSKLEDFL